MKILYEFKLTDKDKKAREYRVVKPSRRQVESAEMEYSVKLSECIKRGILTKTMLAKKYSDTGGLMSEKQAKRLMGLYHDIAEKTNEHSRLSALQKKTKVTKKKMSDLQDDIGKIKREIVDIESGNINLFNDTAESKAQAEVLKWYALHLSQEKVDDEWEDIYLGDSYEDKTESFYEKEDNEEEQDKVYFEAMSRILSVIALWFYNQGQTQDDFDKLLEEYSGEEEVEEAEKSGEKEDDSSDEPAE